MFHYVARHLPLLLLLFRRKPPSPEPNQRREDDFKPEATMNGKWSDPFQVSEQNFDAVSPDELNDYDMDDEDEEHKPEELDRRYGFVCIIYYRNYAF